MTQPVSAADALGAGPVAPAPCDVDMQQDEGGDAVHVDAARSRLSPEAAAAAAALQSNNEPPAEKATNANVVDVPASLIATQDLLGGTDASNWVISLDPNAPEILDYPDLLGDYEMTQAALSAGAKAAADELQSTVPPPEPTAGAGDTAMLDALPNDSTQNNASLDQLAYAIQAASNYMPASGTAATPTARTLDKAKPGAGRSAAGEALDQWQTSQQQQRTPLPQSSGLRPSQVKSLPLGCAFTAGRCGESIVRALARMLLR